MAAYILFLHGFYKKDQLRTCLNLCRDKIRIAVDGGYSFFQKTGLIPDFFIGDFDSAKIRKEDLPEKTEVISFPSKKDKTDSQLALEYCLKKKADAIDIIMPEVGEIDHFLGNIMLLTLSVLSRKKKLPPIRFLCEGYEINLVVNRRLKIKDRAGTYMSVLPLSGEIRLTTKGMEYTVDDCRVKRGESLGLRNRIVRKMAEVEIGGRALVIYRI